MELKIIQTNDNGMFGGTYLNDFEYVYNNTNYRVKIEQYIKREILINRIQEVILAHQYDNKLVEIEGYNSLNDFFRDITANINNYSRVPDGKNSINSQEIRSDKKADLKQDSITKAALNHEETKSDNKTRSTLKRLEYLKDNLKEINNK